MIHPAFQKYEMLSFYKPRWSISIWIWTREFYDNFRLSSPQSVKCLISHTK